MQGGGKASEEMVKGNGITCPEAEITHDPDVRSTLDVTNVRVRLVNRV
jgi:hypothetical protein